jgi:hypothetical protein
MGIPCSGNEGQPIAWRIEVARLGPNGLPATAWQRIDGGLATRGFRPPDAGEYCDGPQVPSLALAGGWVAYAVEAPTVLDPGGSRVLVRSVADGALVRTYDAPEEVLLVALSVTSVAWSETANELLGARAPSWRLVQATIDRGQPRTVPIGVEPTPARNFPPLFLLDGDALIVTIDDFAAVTSSVVRITGGSLETIDAGMPGRSCGAWAAITNLVLFDCQDQQPADWIAVWTPDAGLRAIAVMDSADNGVQGFDGRWLILSHYDYTRQQSSVEAVPVASLR